MTRGTLYSMPRDLWTPYLDSSNLGSNHIDHNLSDPEPANQIRILDILEQSLPTSALLLLKPPPSTREK